jgi:aquaporin Z
MMKLNHQPYQVFRWFSAELIGTFFLTTVLGVAIFGSQTFAAGYTGLFAPFAIGATMLVLFYVLSTVSGAHFNPAISLGMYAFRRIRTAQLGIHLVAQLVGAWLGALTIHSLTNVAPVAFTFESRPAATAEFFGTLLFAFAFMTVALRKVRLDVGGLVIGAALFAGLTLAAITGAGFLNPAIALAFQSRDLALLLMPILGGITGAAAAVFLHDPSSIEH